jgi:hypothetical protein
MPMAESWRMPAAGLAARSGTPVSATACAQDEIRSTLRRFVRDTPKPSPDLLGNARTQYARTQGDKDPAGHAVADATDRI